MDFPRSGVRLRPLLRSITRCPRGAWCCFVLAGAALGLIAVGGGCKPQANGAQNDPVVVFRDQSFYQERVEAEATFEGVLRKVDAQETPSGRNLPFLLNDLSLYPGGEETETILNSFVDLRVEVSGKLVDLSAEGFGREIWAGTIRRIE